MRRIQDGQEEQAKEGTESGVDISKVGGCVEGMWNEDDGGVYFGLPADNRCVRGNPPNPKQNADRARKRGEQYYAFGGGTSPWTWTSKTHLGKTSDGSFGLLLLLLYGEDYAWWVQDEHLLCGW